jgi:hypothetical protein
VGRNFLSAKTLNRLLKTRMNPPPGERVLKGLMQKIWGSSPQKRISGPNWSLYLTPGRRKRPKDKKEPGRREGRELDPEEEFRGKTSWIMVFSLDL